MGEDEEVAGSVRASAASVAVDQRQTGRAGAGVAAWRTVGQAHVRAAGQAAPVRVVGLTQRVHRMDVHREVQVGANRADVVPRYLTNRIKVKFPFV